MAVEIVKLIALDVFASLFLWWLIVDDPRRKRALILLIPGVLLINVFSIGRMSRKRSRLSITLPLVYLCGLSYGTWWLIRDFKWWLMLLLVIPLLLFINSVRRLTVWKDSNQYNEI